MTDEGLRIKVSTDILGDRETQDKVNKLVLPAMAEAGYPVDVIWTTDRYFFIYSFQWSKGAEDAWHKSVALAYDALGMEYEVVRGGLTV